MSISETPGYIFHQLRLSLEGRILTIILKNTIATIWITLNIFIYWYILTNKWRMRILPPRSQEVKVCSVVTHHLQISSGSLLDCVTSQGDRALICSGRHLIFVLPYKRFPLLSLKALSCVLKFDDAWYLAWKDKGSILKPSVLEDNG